MIKYHGINEAQIKVEAKDFQDILFAIATLCTKEEEAIHYAQAMHELQ